MKSVWKTSGGRTSRSDEVNILATRPEVTLDFCYSEGAGEAPEADSAPVVARIVMNPAMAKRLAETLADVVGKHESAYGSIDEKALAGGSCCSTWFATLAFPTASNTPSRCARDSF